MTDFLLRNLDPQLMQSLQQRAERNHRSMQAEIHCILQRATRLNREESLSLIDDLQDRSPLMPDSTPLIRQARDSR